MSKGRGIEAGGGRSTDRGIEVGGWRSEGDAILSRIAVHVVASNLNPLTLSQAILQPLAKRSSVL